MTLANVAAPGPAAKGANLHRSSVRCEAVDGDFASLLSKARAPEQTSESGAAAETVVLRDDEAPAQASPAPLDKHVEGVTALLVTAGGAHLAASDSMARPAADVNDNGDNVRPNARLSAARMLAAYAVGDPKKQLFDKASRSCSDGRPFGGTIDGLFHGGGAATALVSNELELGETSISTLASDAAIEISAASFETHFPATIASALPCSRVNADQPSRQEEVTIAARVVDVALKQSSAQVKVLNIRLEPESLGAIDVRMRLSRSHIDIQITPTSPEATRLLGRSQDELVRVIGAAGYEAQNVVIQLNSIASDGHQHGPPSDNGGASQNGFSFGYSGRQEPSERKTPHIEGRNDSSTASATALDHDRPGQRPPGDVYL